MNYVTDVEPGHGLLRVDGAVIPFDCTIPRDTEFSLNVTRTDGSEAAPEQLATLAFAVPGTLTPGSSFTYSVSSGVFATASESSYTNSFSYPTTYIPVKAHYTLTAEGAVIGYPFEVSITDEDGEPVSGAAVSVDGTVQEELTDENGKLSLTISEARTLTMYACAAVLSAHLPDAVGVNALNGDGLLNTFGYSQLVPFTLICCGKRSDHRHHFSFPKQAS